MRRGSTGRWGWTSGRTARSRWHLPSSRRFSRCAPGAGPGPTSGSLHQGLNALGPDVDAVVVMLGDMVRVSAETLAMLVAAARGTEAPLVVSRYGDVTAPPLLFRRALFGELLAWTGEGCGKAVVQAHKHEAMYVDRPEALLVDVDTPEDFAAAQGAAGT